MKCENCAHQFKLPGGGHGQTGVPGTYFRCGVTFLLVALMLLVFHEFAWSVLCVFFAAIMLKWARVATDPDVPHLHDCPHCGCENEVKPWSL